MAIDSDEKHRTQFIHERTSVVRGLRAPPSSNLPTLAGHGDPALHLLAVFYTKLTPMVRLGNRTYRHGEIVYFSLN